ncbi:TrbI F-type domain-containing protein [Novosphingobium sp. UBA1939]|uniref:TrbI F-type domain-containing protein n=1 Tax=Novosphingobium sp. UBA1939 TaxID=1946982 RepID=UPI0025FB738C|nr:TrbI F-type domain-containing protein [Novosphingobium sp. UBA1939]
MATTTPSLSVSVPGEGDPIPVSSPATPAVAAPPRRRGFAGFSWGQLLGSTAIAGAVLWGAWITRDVHVLQSRRIVSVNLAAMMNDFVMAEARTGNSPEQTEIDTRQYMAALQSVLKQRARAGETILVGEAVVSSSTPNITAEVREAVGKLILANPAPRMPASPAGANGAAPQGSGNAGLPASGAGAIVPNGAAGQVGVMPAPAPAMGGGASGASGQ